MIKNLKVDISIFIGAWLFALVIVYFNSGTEQLFSLLPWFLGTLPLAFLVSIVVYKIKTKYKK